MNSLSVMRIQNDVLIPLVEKRPVLWDSTFEVPKRKKAKRKAWKDLCKELHGDFEEMDDEEKDEYVNGVKQRWQCLQDTYFKKKELDSSSSGVKKYIYAEKMRFLEKNSIESPDVSASCSNGFSNEPSKDVPTPDPPFSKLAADLVFQKEKTDNLDTLKNLKAERKEKTDNFDTLKNLKADNIEPTSSGDESFKSIQTSCSDESMDEQHEDRIVELPKDRFSKRFLKNGFTDEPPKDRSTPKHQAKDLGFHEEVSEEINNLKTREKSKKAEDRDELCASESSEDILTKNLELTDEEDGTQPKNGLPKNRFPKKLQNNESTDRLAKARSTSKRESSKVGDVTEKTVSLKNGRKSKPENAEPKNLTDDPSEGSSGESLKDVFAEKLQGNKSCKELSKKKSSKNLGKNKPLDQLPDSKTSKKPQKNKSTDQLPENRTSKKPLKNKSTDQLPDKKISKNPQKNKSTDHSPENKTSKNPHINKSTDHLPENKTSKKLCRRKSSDQLPEDSKKRRKNKTTDQLPSRTSKRLCESKCTDQLSTDKLVEDSLEGNFLNDSSAGFTTKPSKFTGNRSRDKLTDDPQHEFSCTPPENGFSSDEPPVLEIEGDTGVPLGQSSREVNHLGSMQLKPELSSTFNLFLHSVAPHLNQLDQSEVLEFQMGVLQVIGHINEKRKERLHPQLFLDPKMPSISEF